MNSGAIVTFVVTLIFIAFWILAFFIFYHLTRFGVGILPKRLSALFLVGAVILFSTSVLFYSTLNL